MEDLLFGGREGNVRAKRILTSQRGFGLTEVVVSAGVLSVIALGMATLTDTVSRSQRTSRTIASRDDLKSSVDRFSKNYSALKNSALNPDMTDPGNLKFSNCMGTPRGGPPCDFAETPFVLLGPLVGSGAWPQSTTPYSGNFDTNGAPCAVAGPNCPIIVRTAFTCVDPCPAGNQVFQINYTIDGAAGSNIPIRHIDTVGRVFEATGPLIQNANPSGGTANTLARWNSSGNSIGSSQILEDATGRVGLGTTTPTNRLEVSGVSGDTGTNLLFIDGNGPTPGLTGDMIRFRSQTGNTNLGLRTLHVEGNIACDSGCTNTLLYLEHSNPFAMAGAGYILHTKAGKGGTISESVITQEGNWGIGTTTPARLLHVRGGSAGTVNYLASLGGVSAAAGTAVGIAFDPEGYDARTKGALVYEAKGGGWSQGDFHFLQNSASDASNAGLGNAVMTIRNSGNVGIGITTPAAAARLDVRGGAIYNINSSGNANLLLGEGEGLGEYGRIGWNSAGNYIHIGTQAGGENIVVVNDAGNVGIGTTAPANKLQIGSVGSSGFGANELAIGNGTQVMSFSLSSFPAAIWYTNTNFLLLPSGTGATGYVGLAGCTDPDHVLELGGSGPGCNTGAGSWVVGGNTAWTANSSREWKENIAPFDVPDILTRVRNVTPRTFDWKPEYRSSSDRTNHLGFIAEEFYPVLERGDDKHINGQDIMVANWLATRRMLSILNIASAPADTPSLTIDGSGNVGVGTTEPSYKLHVVGDAGLSTGTAWTNASDIRLKDIHGDYEYGLGEVLKLHTVRFNYKKDNPLKLPSDHPMTGFIAQEVQQVIPDAVHENENGYLELNVDPIHWAVVNAVKELYRKFVGNSDEIATLKAENAALKARADHQEAENAALKSYLCTKDPQASLCQ